MIKNLLVLFGLLDLISFIRSCKIGLKLLISLINPIPLFGFAFHLFEFALIASLLISGTLLMFKKRSGLIIYYGQFIFKLAFIVLTFGFLLKVFGLPYSSLGYKLIAGLVITLEFIRLVLTIIIHRKHFYNKSNISTVTVN
jgi:hypothetical protein